MLLPVVGCGLRSRSGGCGWFRGSAGRAEQAGADVRILNGGAGEPFQGGGHKVGPAGLMGQDEGVAEVPRRSAGLSELVVGIAQAAAGVGEADLRA